MTNTNKTKHFRVTAIVVGALFVGGMVIGMTGHGLIQSTLGKPNYLATISLSTVLAIGALLMLMTSVGDALHGILMFPVLKRHNEGMAFGYFGFRIVNSAFLAVQVLFVLSQLPLGIEFMKSGGQSSSFIQVLSNVFIQTNLFAYHIAMIFLGFAGIILCNAFYRAKLIPSLLAVWGLVGYAIILCGSLLEVLGFDLKLIHALPGGLWELFIGVWLIAKGFNSYRTESHEVGEVAPVSG